MNREPEIKKGDTPEEGAGRSVSEREKEHTARISELFSSIAPSYDFLNRFNSFRRDVAWRRFTARKLSFFNTRRYLDVATGTADLAIEVARQHPGVSVVGLDLVEPLMEIGRDKIKEAGLDGRIELMKGNALELPFDEASFDASGVAFGIRNIQDRLHALREMKRVVAPGGTVAVLELCYYQRSAFRVMYDVYLTRIMPFMARFLSSNPEAYSYLARSILNFPPPDEFMDIMREAGLVDVRDYPLTFGVSRLFTGRVPGEEGEK